MLDPGKELPSDPELIQPPGTSLRRERALVLLIVVCVAGTLNLVVSIQRQAIRDRDTKQSAVSTVAAQPPEPETRKPETPLVPATAKIVATPRPAPPPGPSMPPVPPEDPTKKALAELALATTQELDAARRADQLAQVHERARQSAVEESERWRRREMLVKQQVDSLSNRADKLDREIDTLAAQRDVLARERDALKAAVAKSKQGEGSYAVLPYKGPNGSWRRPIVLECGDGSVTLRPKGPTFSMLDLSSLINPRSSPVITAIARELIRVQESDSPDGAPVTPYFVFLVRPDGIRPYYELRARLEPLGISFGYELIEQDLKVDVPDFDNLATWDGTIPLEEPLIAAPEGSGGSSAGGENNDGLAWPGVSPRSIGRDGPATASAGGRARRSGGADSQDDDPDAPETFVWPSRRSASRGTPANPPLQDVPSGRGELAQGRSTGMKDPTGTGGGSRQGHLYGPRLTENVGRGGSSNLRGPGNGSESGPWPRGGSLAGIPDLEPAEAGAGTGAWSQETSRLSGPGGESSARGDGPEIALVPSPSNRASNEGFSRSGNDAAPFLGSVGNDGNAPAGSTQQNSRQQAARAAGGSGAGFSGGGQGQGQSSENLGVSLGAGSSGTANASASSGGSGLALGADSAPGPKSGKADDRPPSRRFGSRIPDGPTPSIDVPFEIVVVCQPQGLIIHPGGYRITAASLERNKKDGVLTRELLAVARQRAAADPNIRPLPRVKFLVESGGGTMFWNARRQILFSELGWPMSLQVTGTQEARLLGQETWR